MSGDAYHLKLQAELGVVVSRGLMSEQRQQWLDAKAELEEFQEAFDMFDKDGGGSISTDEIKQVLSFGQTLDEAVID